MNKYAIIIGIILFLVGSIFLFMFSDLLEEEIKQVPCVDGDYNLINNLPEDITCSKRYNILFGSEVFYILYCFFVLIGVLLGILLIISGITP